MPDDAGNLYSTTNFGGGSGLSAGTVFKLDPAGNETVLYGFSGGTRREHSRERVLCVTQEGNLYGTTIAGGNLSYCGGQGCGVVFKLDQTGNETVLYSLPAGRTGRVLIGDLLRDDEGNLYGTTLRRRPFQRRSGVQADAGRRGQWTETVLYPFTGGADGV